MSSKHFFTLALAGMALSPAVLQGCSSSASNPLCCTEFKVGGTIDANIGGSAQSQVAVQAIADISGIASAAIDDLTSSCRAIAQDLSAAPADQDSAEANTDKNAKMKAWCSLAVKQIGTIKGSATLKIDVKPPVCEASVSAKLDCQAKCSGGVKCDIKANPPKCTGGTLSVDCKGGCTGSATAPTIACTGSCSGKCSGSCNASATSPIDCAGKCEGTCTVDGTANTASGVKADGTCGAKCTGKCTFTDPKVQVDCKGSCDGSCDAKCTATPGSASVKCGGTCDAEFTPLACSGGKLEGGCTADVKCDANCNGSVQAKASCSPPELKIAFSGTTNVDKLIATLEANLPKVFELQTRFKAMADITGSLSGNASAVIDIKAACLPALVSAAGQAVSDLGDSLTVTASLTASVGG
jgi:hypothetical protein